MSDSTNTNTDPEFQPTDEDPQDDPMSEVASSDEPVTAEEPSDDDGLETDGDEEVEPYEELTDAYMGMKGLLKEAGLGKSIRPQAFVDFVNKHTTGKRTLAVAFRDSGGLDCFYVEEEF